VFQDFNDVPSILCVCTNLVVGIRGYGALILSDWGMVKKMSTPSIERIISPSPLFWTCFSGVIRSIDWISRFLLRKNQGPVLPD
jgi:hypothetical protein